MGGTQTPTRRRNSAAAVFVVGALLIGIGALTGNLTPTNRPSPHATPSAVIDAEPRPSFQPGPRDRRSHLYDLEVYRVNAPTDIAITYTIGAVLHLVSPSDQARETTGNIWKRRVTARNDETILLRAVPVTRGAHVPTHMQCKIWLIVVRGKGEVRGFVAEDPPHKATVNANQSVSCSTPVAGPYPD
ncbi:MAG TPA: hypothetical protein VMT30_08345 [Candidatus Saccharimonadia bacterium]|nr:hypothetical protein [Candidatus Saccharimonadia bacterium]